MILLALLAGILWNLFAGLFYCWSVFIEPLEAALGVSRASVSTVFAVGVVCYSAGMFLSPHILVRVSLPRIAAGLGLAAGCGLAIAGLGQSLALVILGFGVVFAATLGVGYQLALQTASLELPVRRSLAISLSVTAFAGAALVWPAPLSMVIASLGPFTTLLICAAVLAGIGFVCAVALHLSGAEAPAAKDDQATHLAARLLHRRAAHLPADPVLVPRPRVRRDYGAEPCRRHCGGVRHRGRAGLARADDDQRWLCRGLQLRRTRDRLAVGAARAGRARRGHDDFAARPLPVGPPPHSAWSHWPSSAARSAPPPRSTRS